MSFKRPPTTQRTPWCCTWSSLRMLLVLRAWLYRFHTTRKANVPSHGRPTLRTWEERSSFMALMAMYVSPAAYTTTANTMKSPEDSAVRTLTPGSKSFAITTSGFRTTHTPSQSIFLSLKAAGCLDGEAHSTTPARLNMILPSSTCTIKAT